MVFPIPGAAYHLVPGNAPHKVLGCRSGECGSGTHVVLWDRDNSPNQNWVIEDRGNGCFGFAPQHAPGQRLDTNNGCGNTCHIWDTAGDGNNQTFRLEHVDGGRFLIRRACDGACLDVANYATDNGATLHAWADCTRAPNQQWSFAPVGGPVIGGVYHLIPANATHKVLGCRSGACESGTHVVLWDRDGSPNQNWIVEDRNGFYAFSPQHAPGQKLDLNINGNPCHIWDPAGDQTNQTFRLEPVGDGRNFSVRRVSDGACLDVANYATENGATLHGWHDCTRQPNQLWSFERVA